MEPYIKLPEPYLVVWATPEGDWRCWYPGSEVEIRCGYFGALGRVLWNRVIKLREVKVHV